MANKNISKKEVSTKAVSKKAVVQEEKIVGKRTLKKERSPVNEATKKITPGNEPKKVVVVKEMDNFMSEGEVSVKRIALKIWDVVFWVLFAVLACVWIVDFFRVKAEKNPIFCISEDTIEFEDGSVDKCIGLGYTVYDYDRSSLDSGIEFGPFFIKMQDNDAK